MVEKRNIRIEVDSDECEELEEFKERMGLTWEGVLKYGIFNE